jgi:hypothetical protein
MISPLYGLQINIIDDSMLAGEHKQFRFPRSKKQRIRKKWRRCQTNFRFIPNNTVYQIGNILYCSRYMAESLKKELGTQQQEIFNG